jgi:hypothetical protein
MTCRKLVGATKRWAMGRWADGLFNHPTTQLPNDLAA